MRFAIEYAVTDPAWSPAILTPAALADFARAAEDAGYAGLAVTDHPAPSRRWVDAGGEGSADPMSALAFAAAHTTRLRLLTSVLVPALRAPVVMAHQVATVDRLSAGRLTLGLGTGYLRSEFRAVGADFDRRRESFDEAVDVLRATWATGPATGDLTYDGRGFAARDTHVRPPLAQRPHPPIWIHGNGRWGRRRVARYAQGWMSIFTTETLARTIRTTGLPDLAALGRALDDLGQLLEAEGRRLADLDIVNAGRVPRLDIRKGWDTDAVLADVAALEALGVTWMIVNTCGDDPAAALDTVRAFGADVVAPTGGPGAREESRRDKERGT